MSIRAITGKPGSGKTYVAIDHLLKNYFKKVGNEYSPTTDITIITNIDSLKLDHISLDDLLGELKKNGSADPVRDFFSGKYHEKFHDQVGRCLFIIDECQRYFPTMLGMKSHAPEIYYFFEYHRHWGYDIYLISQDKDKIAKGIRPLIETELQALPRTVSLMGELKYYEFVDDEKISATPRVIRPKKEVFALYKSMTFKENEKTKKPVLMFAALSLVLIAATVTGGGFFLKKLSHANDRPPEKAYSVPIPKKKPVIAEIQPPSPISIAQEWVRIDWAMWGDSVWLKDPLHGNMVSAKFFQYQLRKDGTEYYALIIKPERGRFSRFRSGE